MTVAQRPSLQRGPLREVPYGNAPAATPLSRKSLAQMLLAQSENLQGEAAMRKFIAEFPLEEIALTPLVEAAKADPRNEERLTQAIQHNIVVHNTLLKDVKRRQKEVAEAQEKGICTCFKSFGQPPVAPAECAIYRSSNGTLFKRGVVFKQVYDTAVSNVLNSSSARSSSSFWSIVPQCILFACLREEDTFMRLSYCSTTCGCVGIFPSLDSAELTNDAKTFYRITDFFLTLVHKKNTSEEELWRPRVYGMLKAALKAARRATRPEAKRRGKTPARSLTYYRNLISNSMDQRILESDESDEEHGEEDEETQAVV